MGAVHYVVTTSSKKPEVHNALQRIADYYLPSVSFNLAHGNAATVDDRVTANTHQISAKCAWVSEMCKRADKQTNKHTHHNTSHSSLGRSNNK